MKAHEAIKIGRVMKGMSQTDLADQLGVTQAAVSQMEQGKRAIKYATLERCAEILDLNLEISLKNLP